MSKRYGEYYFDCPYRIGEGTAAEFSCRADYTITPGCPQVFDTAMGTWLPADPPEVEVSEVRVEVTVDGASRWAVPNPHIQKLIERFMERKEFAEELIRDAERELV